MSTVCHLVSCVISCVNLANSGTTERQRATSTLNHRHALQQGINALSQTKNSPTFRLRLHTRHHIQNGHHTVNGHALHATLVPQRDQTHAARYSLLTLELIHPPKSHFIVRMSQHLTLHPVAVATSTGRCGSHAAAGAPRAAAAGLPSQTVAEPACSNLYRPSDHTE